MGDVPYYELETRDKDHQDRILSCIQTFFLKQEPPVVLEEELLMRKLKYKSRRLNLLNLREFGIPFHDVNRVYFELRAVGLIPSEYGFDDKH